MTRTQQTAVLTRLRELEAALASVQHGHEAPVERRPPYLIGRCQAIVASALREAGETPLAKVEGR
jgi:hypothetical protein